MPEAEIFRPFECVPAGAAQSAAGCPGGSCPQFPAFVVQFIALMLELVPNDNQGARYLQADLYFYEGRLTDAAEGYKQHPPHEGLFSMALLTSVQNRSAAAATSMLSDTIAQHALTAVMLHLYLVRFKVWERKQVHKKSSLPMQALHRAAHVHAWNEFVGLQEDYREWQDFRNAAEYIGRMGPIWVKSPGSFDFLDQALGAAEPRDEVNRTILDSYSIMAAEDRQRYRF